MIYLSIRGVLSNTNDFFFKIKKNCIACGGDAVVGKTVVSLLLFDDFLAVEDVDAGRQTVEIG